MAGIDDQTCSKCGGELAVVLGIAPLTFECIQCGTREVEQFPLLGTVKIVQLNAATKEITGTEGITRQPKVGDIGAIVERLAGSGEPSYEVECVSDGGQTIWLGTFLHIELELVHAN